MLLHLFYSANWAQSEENMSEKGYVPPYTISDKTVNLISAITEIITQITINDNMSNNPRLRRDNRIRTIHASLAIENNSL